MTPEQKIAALRADNARVYEQVRRIVAAERRVIIAAKCLVADPGSGLLVADLIAAVRALEDAEGEGKVGVPDA